MTIRLPLFITALLLSLSAITGTALAEEANTTDAAILSVLAPIADNLSAFVFYELEIFGTSLSVIVVWMALPMLFLTYYFNFINLRGFKHAFNILRGKYKDDKAPGEVTQFQALATALSGTVGVGNIAGVGVAIGIGGPGATFWLIIIGLCAMSLKFAECTLGVKYREIDENGVVSGGPMYYLKNGLAARGLPKLGMVLAISYAGFGLPTIIQWATVNQVYQQVESVLPIFSGLGFGIAFAFLVGVVIIGGLKEIAHVTSVLVPFMVVVYLGAAFFILGSNFTEIPAAFGTIVSLAFEPEALGGSIVGVIMIGMRRAVYSTEAGLGTSSMVHAAAKTNEPVSEGLVGLLEPFIDSVIVCTITALVIVISGEYTSGEVGITLTSAAFANDISFFPYILAFAVLLFGYSTVISWGYYCEKIWTFAFGQGKPSVMTYKFIFLSHMIVGGVMTTTQVFDIIDSLFFLMAVPNIIGIYIMAPELKRDLQSYMARVKSGEIKETVKQPVKLSA
ncbi:MAG: alanine:cation symporter family protein [Sphingomonadales bacterium]|nr:alanine:cation symporter family protein [Sphingomonadales bacterium]